MSEIVLDHENFMKKACKKAAKQSTKGVCQVLTGTATALFGGVELALGVAGTGPLDD